MATVVTYARLPPKQLFVVDEAGTVLDGLGRGLVLLNYPISLAAIAVLGVVGGRRILVWPATALCAVTVVPGVIDQNDLDARWINIVPALGVGLAFALTLMAARGGAGFVREARGDRLRLVLAGLLLVLALPWFAAELGFYFPGDVFLGEEVPAKRDPDLAAVHLGFHHGNGGVLLALTALLLSRAPAGRLVRAYLSGILAYGLGNAIQDGWNEQLWKRGWVDLELPSVQRPDLTLGWLVVLAGGVLIYALWFRPEPGR